MNWGCIRTELITGTATTQAIKVDGLRCGLAKLFREVRRFCANSRFGCGRDKETMVRDDRVMMRHFSAE